MKSNYYTMTVPLGGTWVYQNTYLNLDGTYFETPRFVMFSNTTDYDMIVKLMDETEGDGADFTGIFVRAKTDVTIKSSGNSYRVGAKFVTAQAGNGTMIVSGYSYNKNIVYSA